jgi:hypothetical protein
MSAVQWGTVSTWVASVGTVAAVSLALWEARGLETVTGTDCYWLGNHADVISALVD